MIIWPKLYLCICVYLCIWICVFGCQTRGNIVFEVLVRFPFQKYIISWVFPGFCYSGAISGIGFGLGLGWDLCVGLLYEHRFAVLITKKRRRKNNNPTPWYHKFTCSQLQEWKQAMSWNAFPSKTLRMSPSPPAGLEPLTATGKHGLTPFQSNAWR